MDKELFSVGELFDDFPRVWASDKNRREWFVKK